MSEHIFTAAHQRGTPLPYAGAVTATEAFELLSSDPGILLIDVRTNAERDWVGQPAINPAQFHAVQWNHYPTQFNNDFINELGLVIANATGNNKSSGKNTILLFLCRSGVRSRAAAQLATEHGYTCCYDILAGFEGDKDAAGHRKSMNGWCFDGLPWRGA